MCLVVFAYDLHPEFLLALAGNRDEFYDRPSAPLDYWTDNPNLLGGRDLKGGGTWMAVGSDARWGAVTNYRDPASLRTDALSRGALIKDYLEGEKPTETYLHDLGQRGRLFNGYNLLLGDRRHVYYASNFGAPARRLPPGLYGLSNHLLDTPWPKVERAKRRLGPWLRGGIDLSFEEIFQRLEDSTPAPDEQLPDTGVGLALERLLSPMFIESDSYGTRSSTVFLLSRDGRVQVAEKTHPCGEHRPAEASIRCFSIDPA